MSSHNIKSDLFAELSAEEQQNLSGGRSFWGRKPRPDVTVNGILTDSSGNSFPVRIFGFIAGKRSRRPQPYSFNRY